MYFCHSCPSSVNYTIIESTIKVKADCYWKNMVFGLDCLWDKSNEYRQRNGGEDSTESQETISSRDNRAPQSSLKCWKQWNWSCHEINNRLLGWCCAVIIRGRHLMLHLTPAIVLTVQDIDVCHLKCIVCCSSPSSLIIKCQTSFCLLLFLVCWQQACSCFIALPPLKLFPP